MGNFKLKEAMKDKGKLLMFIPLILVVLFLVVLIFEKNKTTAGDIVPKETSKALLEPESDDEKKIADKKEAYRLEREEELRKQRELEQSQVRGSDFFLDLQESDDAFDEKRKERIRKMQNDPYTVVTNEYNNGRQSGNSAFANRMRQQLDDIEDQETFNQIVKNAKKDESIRKELEKNKKFRDDLYKKFIAQSSGEDQAELNVAPKVEEETTSEDSKAIFIVEDGKRKRRSQFNLQQKENLIKAAVYGDQVIVSGSAVKMRLLEPLWVGGVEIPENTLFYGNASVGANRLKITVENLRYGKFISPVAFTIYDSDAIEGLNLPNNMKAEAARKMESGLLQGVQLPISSIGTVTSEVTSAITATTQVAKQILNQNLSQVRVHLKANYNLYIKEETKEDKLKREAEDAEIERLYKQAQIQQNEPVKKNPLTSLIESL